MDINRLENLLFSSERTRLFTSLHLEVVGLSSRKLSDPIVVT
jgi:hypothetical protein